MQIQLSDHFNTGRLLRFTLPSVASMVFTSVYGIVDGYFVSNYVGKIPFTGLNLIWPFVMMLGAAGNMIGVGGSALVGMTLGQGRKERANQLFSFFIYFMILSGAVLSVVGYLFVPQVSVLLGADPDVLPFAIVYGRINMLGLTFLTLQYAFQAFMITAEQPKVGFYVTVASGVANMVLDAVLIAGFGMGIEGAAWATIASQAVGSVVPIFLFFRTKNRWIIRLGRPAADLRALGKACTNGASEFLTSVSMSIVGMLYNFQLLRYAGNDGVAAYGVIMYVAMIFIAVNFGFSMGVGPLFSFQHGAENRTELKNLFARSMRLICISSVIMLVAAELLAKPLAYLFTGYDSGLLAMTTHGFVIVSFSFLLCGPGMFGASMFTALNNGLISALTSFIRTVALQVLFVFLLPLFWGLDGIWWSSVFTEGFATLVTVLFIWKYRNRYGYL